MKTNKKRRIDQAKKILHADLQTADAITERLLKKTGFYEMKARIEARYGKPTSKEDEAWMDSIRAFTRNIITKSHVGTQ